MYVIGYPLLAIVKIISSLLFIYSLIVLAACIISFTNIDRHNEIVKIINSLTYPVFAYFRKYIPNFGMIDLTPLAVMLILMFIINGILPIFKTFALGLIY